MLRKVQHYIASSGWDEGASNDRKVWSRTLNWILLLTFIASMVWSFCLYLMEQYIAMYFPLFATVSISIAFVIHHWKRNFHRALDIYILTLLFLPPMVHLFHGGFVNSGAVIAWSILAPISAMVFKRIKRAKLIFLAFIILLISTTIIGQLLKIEYQVVSSNWIIAQFLMTISGVVSICYFPLLHFTNEMIAIRRLVREQNEKIVSSIQYAKYIQNASLLTTEELDAQFNNDYFLYFEPKDIVSGDFYWSAHKNGRLIIACGDCTGHGVPGAFMTMLGINHLNNIVREKGITDPSIILLFLHYSIKDSLKHSSRNISDGMDIAICSVDIDSGLLEYSGAMSRLYYFNGSLKVYGPTKASIGDSKQDVNFEKHSIRMNKGDSFYMLSDGYIDQFGGEGGKRYGSKRVRELINRISKMDIKEQGEIVKTEMERWKVGQEQIDDITFLGLRV